MLVHFTNNYKLKKDFLEKHNLLFYFFNSVLLYYNITQFDDKVRLIRVCCEQHVYLPEIISNTCQERGRLTFGKLCYTALKISQWYEVSLMRMWSRGFHTSLFNHSSPLLSFPVLFCPLKPETNPHALPAAFIKFSSIKKLRQDLLGTQLRRLVFPPSY